MSYFVILIADTASRHALAPHLRSRDYHVIGDLAELLPEQHSDVTVVEPITNDYGDPAYRVSINPEGYVAEFEAFPPEDEDFEVLISNIQGVIQSPGEFGFEDDDENED